MADYNLGTARGVIEIEYKGDGPRQAQRDLRGTGSEADAASKKMGKAGTAMAGAGALIAGGLALALNSAANFEKQLSGIAAVSGATGEEMDGIRKKALQLGKDTQFSAAESAQAIEELVKAGLSVQDVMSGAADATVALAAAGEVSMPEAATIASNAMNQFQLTAKEMPKVADAIAGAANASAIDVSEFGYSLSQVGAVAHLAGVSFEDTATAIALMGNAGIKGSDAGTSLKSMFQHLIPVTKKQKDLMKELGIITADGSNNFYDAQGNMKSMADVSQVLKDSLKGMTKEQKQATLTTLFGSDAIRGAAVLAQNGAKGFDKMATSMGKVTAADVAAKRMDNLKGSIELLKGSVETLMIQIGTPLLNGFRSVVDLVTSVVNAVLSLPEPVLQAATVFAQVLSAALILVGGFLKLRAVIASMQAGLLLFTIPMIAVIAAIAALVAAFVYFYKTNAKFRAFVQGMAADLKDLFGKAIEYLVPRLQEFGKFLAEVFKKSLPYIQQFGTAVVQGFQAILPTILKVVGYFRNLGETLAKNVIPIIKDIAGNVLKALQGAIKAIWPEIQKLIPAVADFVSSFIDLASAIGQKVWPVVQLLISVFKIWMNLLVSTIIPLLLRLAGIFTTVFINVLGSAIQAALGILRGFFNIISGIMKVITGVLTGDWSKAWAGVKQILRGAIGVIFSLLRGMVKVAGSILKGLGQVLLAGIKAIPGLLRGAGSLFLAAGKFLIQQFVNGMKKAAGIIEGIASGVWNMVKGLLNGAIDKINAALEFKVSLPGPDIHINPPNIPHLASGGITNGPMLAVVGDNVGGREVIAPLSDLEAWMKKIYLAGKSDPTKLEMAISSAADNAAPTSTGSRIVSGQLSIDSSGRAWISGLAQDVYDGNQGHMQSLTRMSGRTR